MIGRLGFPFARCNFTAHYFLWLSSWPSELCRFHWTRRTRRYLYDCNFKVVLMYLYTRVQSGYLIISMGLGLYTRCTHLHFGDFARPKKVKPAPSKKPVLLESLVKTKVPIFTTWFQLHNQRGHKRTEDAKFARFVGLVGRKMLEPRRTKFR